MNSFIARQCHTFVYIYNNCYNIVRCEKKMKWIYPVAVIVMLSAFAGAGMQSAFALSPAAAAAAADGTITIVSLHTNKDVYHLGEDMEIALVVHAPESVSSALINVSGLKGRHGKDLFSFSQDTNLSAGENRVVFSYSIPTCGCAVCYGTHFVNASVVVHDGDVANAEHSIVLTSRGNIAYVNISSEETKRMIESENITILDVRTEEEYNAAHIASATLIPASELRYRTDELNKSKKIVVYGHNDTTASDILVEKGFERVYNVRGGINAWEERGHPVVRAPESPEEPGFGAVLAIAALLVIACGIKQKRERR
jgi:rhodanese-related sulfurtransferase